MEIGKLNTYPIPKGVDESTDYTVRVRLLEGVWNKLCAYKINIDMHNVREASMVNFDFKGTVEIEVTKNEGTVDNVVIRPLSYNIKYQKNGNTITIILDKPKKLSFEVNGDRFHNLHIFAGEIEDNIPDIDAKEVLYLEPRIHRPLELMKIVTAVNPDTGKEPEIIYFGPGLHYIEEVILSIPSCKTIYLAGGAVVIGSFLCDSVHDVTIKGKGIIYLKNFERLSSFRGFRIIFSRNINIEGITLINPPHYSVFIGQSENILIRDFKAFSCVGWSDGIDCMSSSNIEIDDVFMRNSDDCIAIYGRRWEFNGDSRNIRVKNSTLWADVAHPMNIGTHGDYYNDGNVIEDIIFENIDVLEHHEPQYNYKGCMAINAGDKNLVRNIKYENIRVEQFEDGRLIDLRVVKNPDYNPEPGKSIENIIFKDISYNGNGEYSSLIQGFNSEHSVSEITIENLRINGKHILDAASGNIIIGDYTDTIIFK